ncbi:MAG TPA: OB-fold nucleic acid binding domain-containing protein, partial [Patescibacteria group bacterium]|nr:OB-fold nucleic acid binding domain-containing protein [Patescibacteria group bacterium]
MTTPATPIEQLPKTTKPLLAALKKLGIETVRDLLLYFPYRYLDFSKVSAVRDLAAGEMVSVKVKIKSIGSRFSFRGRMSLAEAVVSDGTGSIKVTWFNQPYLAKTLRAGDEIFLAGKPDYYNNVLQLTNPIYEKVSDPAYGGAGFPIHTARLVPLYHLAQ